MPASTRAHAAMTALGEKEQLAAHRGKLAQESEKLWRIAITVGEKAKLEEALWPTVVVACVGAAIKSPADIGARTGRCAIPKSDEIHDHVKALIRSDCSAPLRQYVSSPASFIPQRHHGINLRSAPRRNKAGHQCNCDESNCNQGIGTEVTYRDTIDQTRHGTTNSDCTQQT